MTGIDSGMSNRIDESACMVDELESFGQLFGNRVSVISEPESWGQPSADRYILVPSGNRMHGQLISGVYVSSQPGIPMDDLFGYEEEPEDAILVASGILPRLVAQARREPPSLDWEQDLNDL